MTTRSPALAILALVSAPALAHPGHGHGDGFSLLHYVSAAEHVAILGLLAATVAGLGGWWLHRRRSRRRN